MCILGLNCSLDVAEPLQTKMHTTLEINVPRKTVANVCEMVWSWKTPAWMLPSLQMTDVLREASVSQWVLLRRPHVRTSTTYSIRATIEQA